MQSQWRTIVVAEHRFLSGVRELFDEGPVHALVPAEAETFSRVVCNGLIALFGRVHGRAFGVLVCDFRINGGSFGRENSDRLVEFLRAMEEERATVHFQFSTLGFRIMEGRSIFANAFALIPALARFAERNLLFTSIHGQCLGLGALLYGLGHYRLAVSGKCINLTGPEVLRMFFGEEIHFQDIAAVERQRDKTHLVHEVVPTDQELHRRVRDLTAFVDDRGTHRRPAFDSDNDACADPKLRSLLDSVGTGAREIFPSSSSVVAYLVRRGDESIGVLANPPGRMNNLITVDALKKYAAALDLFAAMHVPVISFVDTPGADPRAEQSDANIVGALLEVGKKMIHYRHGLMGVVVGRCFGGATILGFPKAFGGSVNFVLEGARLGIMDERIVSRLLAGSERLAKQWEAVVAEQPADYADLVATGTIDAVIDPSELWERTEIFLQQNSSRHTDVSRLRRLSSGHVPVTRPALAG